MNERQNTRIIYRQDHTCTYMHRQYKIIFMILDKPHYQPGISQCQPRSDGLRRTALMRRQPTGD